MKSRLLIRIGLPILLCVLCWFLPLFHIRPLGSSAAQDNANTGSGSSKTKVSTDLEDYASGGTPVTEFWDACDADFASAQKQYGRQPRLGGAYFFCIQGQGTVVSVEKGQAIVAIEGSQRKVELQLATLADYTVRDAVGITASQFASAEDFNAFGGELGRQVFKEVIKPNRDLLRRTGRVVKFVGCARIPSKSYIDPLSLVPIHLEILNRLKGDPAPPNSDGAEAAK